MGHAKVLVGLDEDILKAVVKEITSKKLNVRDSEKLVNDFKRKPKKEITGNKEVNLEYLEIEKVMREKLGTKVKVDKGLITINYTDTDDLNRLLEILDIKVD